MAAIGFAAWQYYAAPPDLDPDLRLPITAAGIAGVSLLVSIVSYFCAKRTQIKQTAFIAYLSLLFTAGFIVVVSGGESSRYTGIWMIVALFAPLFGYWSAALTAIAATAYTIWQYLIGDLTSASLIAMTLGSLIPVIAGLLLFSRWGHHGQDQTIEDRSYNELASELSQIAGKSEVVINAIGDGVLALDGQGMIQLINPAAQRLLGWGKHDSLNLSYKSVFKMLTTKNQEAEAADDPVVTTLTTNKATKNDNLSLQTQSGKSFIASISVNPVGQLGSGVIIVFRDITAEKSDERQRAEFISTASHEMRTPVASIEGYLGLALNPATATIDEKARDFIMKAHASAQHLGRLFADLLDVSKADDSRLKNDPKVVDIVPFIHDIVQGLTPKAVEKGLRVFYKPMPDGDNSATDVNRRLNPVLYANVDSDHLREVVQNLVENAIKYTLAGEVVIDATGTATHITISVADTGIGIPREDHSHLFQKFYRVDNSDTREIGGTGLGLYLCRRLTETIGGRIWVESEYKKGSTFFVEIPRIDNDEAQRLIERASIEAERQAEFERQNALKAAPPVTPSLTQAPQQPQPFTPATPETSPPAPAQPNVPLSAIEANPGQYITSSRAPAITIPPRRQ